MQDLHNFSISCDCVCLLFLKDKYLIKEQTLKANTWIHSCHTCGVTFSVCFPQDCWISNLKANALYIMYQQESRQSVQALSLLILLAHDSILFHPTSSSSLKHKRKDERKHKKRSVCDCCIRIMYSPNPTQLFLTPLHLLFLRCGKPIHPFQNTHCRRIKREDPPKCSHVGARWVNTETCRFYFSEQSVKKRS